MKIDRNARIIYLASFFVLILMRFSTFSYAESTIIGYGECGENLTWQVDDSGLLTISGLGEMYSYFNQRGPWYNEYSSTISRIVIEEGITSVGETAFANLDDVTEAILPDTLNRIGKEAFANCTALETIIIPDNVSYIGDAAFYRCFSLMEINWPRKTTVINMSVFCDCVNLVSISLHEDIKEIGNYAFSHCKYMPEFTIPSNCEVIGAGAFSGCSTITTMYIPEKVSQIGESAFNCYSLVQLSVSENNPYFKSVDNVLYSKDGSRLLAIPFPLTGSTSTYTVLDGVIEIDRNTFSHCFVFNEKTHGTTGYPRRFDTLILPESYTHISTGDFKDVYINNLEFSGKVERVDRNSFTSGQIKNIYLNAGIAPSAPATALIPETVIRLHVPEGARGYNVLPWSKTTVIYDMSPILLEDIEIEKTEYDAIVGEKFSISFKPVPADTTEDYTVSFNSNNQKIATVSQNGMVTPIIAGKAIITVTAGNYHKECNITIKKAETADPDLILPTSLTTIEAEAFTGGAFSYVVLPEGAASIGRRAFADCPKLAYIYIPASVKSIDANAFDGVEDLTIFGAPESAASEYASLHGFTFKAQE